MTAKKGRLKIEGNLWPHCCHLGASFSRSQALRICRICFCVWWYTRPLNQALISLRLLFMTSLVMSHLKHYVFQLSVCPSFYLWVIKFVSVISYKPLVGILPNLQLWCSWGQRWTDEILSSKVKVTVRPDCGQKTLHEAL